MATIHLSGGVVFVAIVSKYVLGEAFGLRQGLGFVLLAVAVGLIMGERPS
jgi:drug/metabolite transporter (DMT)-like permease